MRDYREPAIRQSMLGRSTSKDNQAAALRVLAIQVLHYPGVIGGAGGDEFIHGKALSSAKNESQVFVVQVFLGLLAV